MNTCKSLYLGFTLACILAAARAEAQQPPWYKNSLAYTLHEYAVDPLWSTEHWFLQKCRDYSSEKFRDACEEVINEAPQNKIDGIHLLHKVQATLQRTIAKIERVQRDTYDWHEFQDAGISLVGCLMFAYGTYGMYIRWRRTRVSDTFLKLLEEVHNDPLPRYKNKIPPAPVWASGIVSMVFLVLAVVQIKDGLNPSQEDDQYLDTYKSFLEITNELIENLQK